MKPIMNDHNFGDYLLHEQEKIGFVNIPKVASQSLKETLRPKGFIQTNRTANDPSKYLMIAIIRFPLYRFISGYMEANDRACADLKKMSYWNMKEGTERILQCLDDVFPQFYDEHITPQHFFIKGMNVTKLIRFEEMGCYLKEFLKPFGIEHLKHANRSNLDERNIIFNFITSAVIAKVGDVYVEDYKLLGDGRFMDKA